MVEPDMSVRTAGGTPVHAGAWSEVGAFWVEMETLPTVAHVVTESGCNEREAADAIVTYASYHELPWPRVESAVLAAKEIAVVAALRQGPPQVVALDEK